MLTVTEIYKLAKKDQESHTFANEDIARSYRNGYNYGYKDCQSTIPSECIGFAEWIAEHTFHQYVNNGLCRWRVHGKKLEYSTGELYSIYLESLKQNK
jgi:hypothetical protein